ncbi:hypothetical protein MOX02_23520 [Methylobacterium oxalidis]|uniref:Uncharacterized protein n=1 Tax=Methylobacterium oxalidis TaxID=944322 RepID=A0A512J2Y4_9HYPH|nr:hypothetical protein MOX02_23520 [Methylobacterium oxalidis]GLS67167.1 hypothetical protein GCM10007888_55500 [Methylobacterium oxalidis]
MRAPVPGRRRQVRPVRPPFAAPDLRHSALAWSPDPGLRKVRFRPGRHASGGRGPQDGRDALRPVRGRVRPYNPALVRAMAPDPATGFPRVSETEAKPQSVGARPGSRPVPVAVAAGL